MSKVKSNSSLERWKKAIATANNMLVNEEFDGFDNVMQEANEAYKSYKKECDLRYRKTNFGMSNYIFEEALPQLFKSNKKVIKEFMTTIKNDKNLLMEFKFFKALEKYNENLDAKEYVNESIALATANINPKTLKESNAKLSALIAKYDIKPNDFVAEDKQKLFSHCDYILSHKKSLSNLNEHNEKVNYIVDYTKKHYNKLNEAKIDLSALIESYNKKYVNLLNEDERSLVQDIIDFRKPQNEERKMKLFNRFKNECLETVNKLMENASDEDKCGLESLKEQLNSKTFCAETLVVDLAKLLEIRDVLMSE